MFFRTLAGFLFLAVPALGADCSYQNRLYQEGKQLFNRSQHLLGATLFANAVAVDCNAEYSARSLFGYAQSLQELGETEEALVNLRTLKLTPRFATFAKRASLYQAFITGTDFDSPLHRARFQVWNNRTGELPSLALDDPFFSKDLKTRILDTHEAMLQARVKRPWVAGVASALIPGAGQAYSGAYQSAAVAFLLNSLFLWTAVELFRKDLPGPAAAAGLVFSVTYFGNIFNAVDSARRVNSKLQEPEERQMKTLLFPEFQLD